MSGLSLTEQRTILVVARTLSQRLGAEAAATALELAPREMEALLEGEKPLTSELVARISLLFAELPTRRERAG